jgi:hypothetical protein
MRFFAELTAMVQNPVIPSPVALSAGNRTAVFYSTKE